jgi:3-(3-hydroxy-phenyl)propionate hydroxylase
VTLQAEMRSEPKPSLRSDLPVAIVGAGPVGLTTATGLAFYGIPFVVFEDDDRLSVDTKAGTTLSRTLEVFRRYGVADEILAVALRVDEIGEIDRATGRSHTPVEMHVLGQETRYPFVINLPQQDMEPVLARTVEASGLGNIRFGHHFAGLEQFADRVRLQLATAQGEETFEASYLLACDGGRSAVREALGIAVEGKSIDERYALVDLIVDLDVTDPRDYPYLAYFSDAREWMILVRQPHCWRFLFPLPLDRAEPTAEELRDKALSFIGEVNNIRVLQKVIYRTHHRVASRWRSGRVFLMGDAAHLITPMWALGLNTGVLDASNLPWRLAWCLRGWADDALLDGYEREQRPVALHGSGEMAEAARATMAKAKGAVTAMTDNTWSNAYTRGMLGVRLDVDGRGDWSMVKSETEPPLRPGDRIPDALLHTPEGREVRLHDLCSDRFLALYFADVRRRPPIPCRSSRALAHFAVSRWDAPLDSGLRDRALLDPGDRVMRRLAVPKDTLVLVRPDEHVAAIQPIEPAAAERLYAAVVGMPPPS